MTKDSSSEGFIDYARVRAELVRRVRAGEEPSMEEVIAWVQATSASTRAPARRPIEVEEEFVPVAPLAGPPKMAVDPASIVIDPNLIAVRDLEALQEFVASLAAREETEPTLADDLAEVARKSPWWILSFAVHLLLVAILAFFVVARLPDERPLSYQVSLVEERADEPGIQNIDPTEEDEPEDVAPPEAEPEPEPEFVPDPQPEPAPLVAEEQPVEDQGMAGAEAAPPTEAAAHLSSLRTGSDRLAATARYGGSAASEEAVSLGLKWLATHQDADGSWQADRFSRQCKSISCRHGQWDHIPCMQPGCTDPSCQPDTCSNPFSHEKYCEHRECKSRLCKDRSCWGDGHADISEGLTGLAVLCFLGAGHTHMGHTQYRDVVRHGVDYLRRLQDTAGCFGPKVGDSGYIYEHAITTLALAEAYALTGDKSLRNTIQIAVDYLAQCQQAGGGWDYTQYTTTKRNDASITGWVVMALKSARLAGIDVPESTWKQAYQFYVKATDKNGEVTYSDREPGARRTGIGLTAVGLLARLYLGDSPRKPIMRKMAGMVTRDPPSYDQLNLNQFHNEYYWYYGTLAMFQFGGKYWESWNPKMRDLLVSKQARTGHATGSWDPDGPWLGVYCGRVYSTALAILNLEIYYRYLPIYGESATRRPLDEGGDEVSEAGSEPGDEREPDTGADTVTAVSEDVLPPAPTPEEVVDEGIKLASSTSSRDRARGVRVLADSPPSAESVRGLILYLSDESPTIRWQALSALRAQKATAAVAPLIKMLKTEQSFLRALIIDTLGDIGDPAAIPALAKVLAGSDRKLDPQLLKALAQLTGQELGPRRDAWLEWLKREKHLK